MKKFLFVIALILFSFPSIATAMRTPIMMSAATSATQTRYAGFISIFTTTNDSSVLSVIAANGIIEGFYVYLSAAPGSGKSYAFTLQKNSSATGLTCTVADLNTSCSYLGTLSLSAGDTLSIKQVPSGTPTVVTANISTIFNSGTGGPALIYTSSNTNNANETRVGGILGNIGWNQSGVKDIMPTYGTFSNLYVIFGTAPGTLGSGKTATITLNKNGVATGLTCTVSETGTTCNDLVNNFSVIPGDFITVSYSTLNTPSSSTATFGMTFTPNIDGESLQLFSYGGGVPSNTVDNFFPLTSNGSNVYSTSEFGRLIPINGISARDIYASITVIGAGKTMTSAVRVNSTTSNLLCINSSSSLCSNTSAKVALSANNLVNFMFSPSGTPTIGTNANSVSCVLYINPNDQIYGSTLYDSKIY